MTLYLKVGYVFKKKKKEGILTFFPKVKTMLGIAAHRVFLLFPNIVTFPILPVSGRNIIGQFDICHNSG